MRVFFAVFSQHDIRDKWIKQTEDLMNLKVEARASNDEELKLTDTLVYFQRDTNAAKVSGSVYWR